MPSSVTLYLRHGTEPTLATLENYTFQTVVFLDGTIMENVTFDQLAEAVWTLQTRNGPSAVTLQTRN